MANRRSFLQSRILYALEKQAAPTISELADRLNAQRPSVSRSLKTLREQGLVIRQRRGWTLTRAGAAEASNAMRDLFEVSTQATASFKRLSDLPKSIVASADFDSIQRTLGSLNVDTILKSDDFRRSFAKVAGLNVSSILEKQGVYEKLAMPRVDQALNLVSGEDLGSALSSVLDVQQRNAELIRATIGADQITNVSKLASQNHQLLATITGDIIAIQQTYLAKMSRQLSESLDLDAVALRFAEVLKTYSGLYSEAIGEVGIVESMGQGFCFEDLVSLPTYSVASYSSGIRAGIAVDSEFFSSRSTPNTPDSMEGDFDELDLELRQLDPEFVEMRQGSWKALEARLPDYLRHAAVSQRELMQQVLTRLVPNRSLPEDRRKGPQIKARAKALFPDSESTSSWVAAQANALMETYSFFSGFTHGNGKTEEELRCIMRSFEWLLLFLLRRGRIV